MNARLLLPFALLGTPLASQQRVEVKVPTAPPPMVDADRKAPAPPPPVKAPHVTPAATAQAPAALPLAKPDAGRAATRTRIPQDAVFVDQVDGRIWARTANYKASFDGAGAAYVPFLGSDAPRNFPVAFTLRSVRVGGEDLLFKANGTATVKDARVSIDRGTLVETYDLGAKAMEQSFVFGSLPTTGDLVVRIGVATELASSVTNEGFMFGNDLGQVSYGQAFVVDAIGQRAAIQSTLDDNTIQLRVPASFLATARFPVTIDPLVTTFTAIQSGLVEFAPDIAYDLSQQQYLVVWEEAFSAIDHDVGSIRQNADGTPVANSMVYIDHTTDNWSHPRVANLRLPNRFLVVAEKGAAPTREIWGRTREAGSSLLSTPFSISVNGGIGDKLNPDVGGDANSAGPVFWTVVFERTYSPTDSDIMAQQVDDLGGLHGGVILVDTSSNTHDTHPAISKSDGGGPGLSQDWTIVWQRTWTATDEDLYFAQIHWSGAVTTPSSLLDNSGLNQTNPVVSSPTDELSGNRYVLVCYEAQVSAGNRDIAAFLLRGATTVGAQNLSILENRTAQDQITPHVDSDGCRFMVAWAEKFLPSGNDWDVFGSTYHMIYGSGLGISDSDVLAATGTSELHPRVTSTRSGGGAARRYASVWDYEFISTDLDIQGAIYSGVRSVPSFMNVPTGCAGLGMSTSGGTALGEQANFQMTGVGANVPLMMFSLPINSIAICSACALGVNLNTATFIAGNSLSIPIPCEGAFVGGTLAVQGLTYGVGPCVSNSITMSNTARFTIR